MANPSKLSMARRELEELYLGIPDDSVNLTFGNLAEVKQHSRPKLPEKRNSGPLDPISETKYKETTAVAPLSKLPSLDFNRALGRPTTITTHTNQHHHIQEQYSHHAIDEADLLHGSRGDHHHHHVDHPAGGYSTNSPRRNVHGVDRSGTATANHDEMSYMSGISMASVSTYPQGRRRPGIPHSNICTICSNYIYFFRHRCLVCGRVYCRQCVGIGMGEMPEGRKCIECLGRRFSQRYIQKAGQIGCCMKFRYRSTVMQQELKWAEKGPRKSGERRYDQSTMVSRSRSPMAPRTPTRAHGSPNSPSFVMNSPFSTYSSTNHPLPF